MDITPAPTACPLAAAGLADGPYRPEDYRPEHSVGYLMRRIVTSLAVAVERELDPRGLTNAQWVPLYKLSLGQVRTAAELARETQLDAGAVTRMLDRLEAKGLVARTRSQADRRVVHLELTAAGRAAADQIPHALCKVLNAHLRGFAPDEVALLHGMLARMLANGLAGAAGAEPAADPAPEDTPA